MKGFPHFFINPMRRRISDAAQFLRIFEVSDKNFTYSNNFFENPLAFCIEL